MEKDLDESKKRILSVVDTLENISTISIEDSGEKAVVHPVNANFFLSADEGTETALPSCVGRELGKIDSCCPLFPAESFGLR